MTMKQQIILRTYSRSDPDERRQSLIDATARCLAKKGVGGTSVRAICTEAGVSAGLLRHYFPTIDAAIAECYRQTGKRVQQALDRAADDIGGARNRLLAYLTASFSPPISDPELLATWLAFWGLSRTSADIAVIHHEIYAAYRAKLEILIADLFPHRDDTHYMAIALTALVDGLWLELSLGNAPFSAQEAATMVERWLDAILSDPK